MAEDQRVFKNESFQFISGIKITTNTADLFDFEIYSSSHGTQENWDEIAFKSESHGSEILVTFRRPINSFLFKIVFSGITDNLSISFIPYKVLSKQEALDFIAQKSIVFLGCARNCAKNIENAIKNLDAVGSLFKSYKIYIFENDSVDETLDILEKLKSFFPLEIIIFKNLDQSFLLRTHRLSFARNMLLKQVKKEAVDYFCVADLDGVIGNRLNIEGVLSNFMHHDCWDAVFPASETIYYDVWALRQKDICTRDYMSEMDSMNPVFDRQTALDFHLRRIASIKFSEFKGWLPVDSAFGGIGFYKKDSFAFSNYYGGVNDQQICEHVKFHKKAKLEGALLYINPSFLVRPEF
jgi:hypothetical protein